MANERSRNPCQPYRPRVGAADWGVVEGSSITREKQCEITPRRFLGGGKWPEAEIADCMLVFRNTKLAKGFEGSHP